MNAIHWDSPANKYLHQQQKLKKNATHGVLSLNRSLNLYYIRKKPSFFLAINISYAKYFI